MADGLMPWEPAPKRGALRHRSVKRNVGVYFVPISPTVVLLTPGPIDGDRWLRKTCARAPSIIEKK